MKYILILVCLTCFLGCKAQQDSSLVKKADSLKQVDSLNKTVYASYYSRSLEGSKTASGARYRRKKLTAAHRTLPLGTIVKVTNPENGKSVVVKVNDRGPYSKKLAIDLSERAAKQLGIIKKGVAKVNLSYTLE